MKTLAAVATIFGMVGAVAAQNPCCDAKWIIEVNYDGTEDMRRRRLAGEDVDTTCVANRKAEFEDKLFDAQGTDPHWMVKGGTGATTTETVFTRMAGELLADKYWMEDDGTGSPAAAPVAEADRVLAIHVPTGGPSFSPTWASTAAAACVGCDECADPQGGTTPGDWTHGDLVAAYANKAVSLVVLTPTGEATDWETYFSASGTGPDLDAACQQAASGDCKIAFVDSTGDVLEDVKSGLTKINPAYPPAPCDICKETTSSTTSSSSSTTEPAGGNPPPSNSTESATTTTADGNSTGRLVAGMVPVATAALLALVM